MPDTSGDTTYTQQMTELEAIRRDAEEEVASTRRKRMTSRLDILQSLGLDNQSLSDAAAIDDALQAQEKAAQQTLDAADAAIQGLAKRHGGIQEAVDEQPGGQARRARVLPGLGGTVMPRRHRRDLPPWRRGRQPVTVRPVQLTGRRPASSPASTPAPRRPRP